MVAHPRFQNQEKHNAHIGFVYLACIKLEMCSFYHVLMVFFQSIHQNIFVCKIGNENELVK